MGDVLHLMLRQAAAEHHVGSSLFKTHMLLTPKLRVGKLHVDRNDANFFEVAPFLPKVWVPSYVLEEY
jgi:hypothetical protein